ncbi:PAS domain-containing protein [Kordiimonas aestuarii]|uniref:hypothetical protein n=1 Tax=Kordiimonas aestuarii TaxID=1005925 RepID=UPI0021D2A38D|nr:hypothetical protein [Kordiimonas aestuarii]
MHSLDLKKNTPSDVTTHSDSEETTPFKTTKREHGELLFYPLKGALPRVSGFEPIIDLFGSKREGHLMPSRKAISFQDLRGWHASFFLIEFDEDLADGRMRILGEMYGTLLTGALWQNMLVSETKSAILQGVDDYFRELLTGPYIGRFRGSLPFKGREHVCVDILDLPMVDDTGTPRYLMSFVREIAQRASLMRGVAAGR